MPQPKVTAQAIQEMLKDVNINVDVIVNDWDTHTSGEDTSYDMKF